mgnify:CR=1 FL=1
MAPIPKLPSYTHFVLKIGTNQYTTETIPNSELPSKFNTVHKTQKVNNLVPSKAGFIHKFSGIVYIVINYGI